MANRLLTSIRLLAMLILMHGLTSCDRVELPAAPDIALDTYPPAIQRQLNKALQNVVKHPRKASANGRMAMLLHSYDQLQGAGVYYARAALLDKTDFHWSYLRAWVQSDEGNIDGALAALDDALAIDPDYARARIRRAELLLTAGRLEECSAALDKLAHDFPDRPEAYFVRSQLALRQNNPDAAIAALEKVREVSGDFGALHQTLAQAYRQSGNEPAMQRHTQLAEQFRNTRADIDDPVMAAVLALNISTTKRLERARGFAARGNIARALQLLESALADEPESLPVHLTLAGVYANKADFDRADQHLQRAAQIDPDYPKLYYNTGIVRFGEQRFVEARQAFRRSLELDSTNADAWTQLGLAHETGGEDDEAITSYRTALKYDPWHRQAHWLLGRQRLKAGQHTEAIEHLALLRTIRDPSSAPILLDLGRAYQAAGQTDQAVAVFQEAVAAAEQFGDSRSRIDAQGSLRRTASKNDQVVAD